jgi:hypothetical protein
LLWCSCDAGPYALCTEKCESEDAQLQCEGDTESSDIFNAEECERCFWDDVQDQAPSDKGDDDIEDRVPALEQCIEYWMLTGHKLATPPRHGKPEEYTKRPSGKQRQDECERQCAHDG